MGANNPDLGPGAEEGGAMAGLTGAHLCVRCLKQEDIHHSRGHQPRSERGADDCRRSFYPGL